jgi:hypothetical protein
MGKRARKNRRELTPVVLKIAKERISKKAKIIRIK